MACLEGALNEGKLKLESLHTRCVLHLHRRKGSQAGTTTGLEGGGGRGREGGGRGEGEGRREVLEVLWESGQPREIPAHRGRARLGHGD